MTTDYAEYDERETMSKTPRTDMEVFEQAIRIINFSRDTHINWLRYQETTPNWETQADPKLVGTIEHHQSCIKDYDLVLSVLTQAQEEIKRFNALLEQARPYNEHSRL